MRFIVFFTQAGDGCDYTIGCGKKYEIIEADSMEDAKEMVIFPDGEDEYSIFHDRDISYDEIIIVPFENYLEINIEEEIEKEEKRKENSQAAKQKRIDEAEFERLKLKLNK